MAKKGTPKEIIDKLANVMPKMFNYDRVKKRMKSGGSPMKVLDRATVKKMWQERETYLKILLEDLKK